MNGSLYRHIVWASSVLILSVSSPLAAEAATDPAADSGESRNHLDDGYGGDPTVPLAFAFEHITPTPDHAGKLAYEINIRVRGVTIPRFVLDSWYQDEDAEDWAYVEGRPRIGGVGFGLEYVIKTPHDSGIFYVEYVDSTMKGGYWDDTDSPSDPLDGDYIQPSDGVGLVGIGADYAYEAPLVTSEETGGRFAMGFIIGGGLGIGILAGQIDQWTSDTLGNPSYKRFQDGQPPDNENQIPRVFPLVDVNTGFRFHFGDRFVLRTEAGLHSALYAGASAGVTF